MASESKRSNEYVPCFVIPIIAPLSGFRFDIILPRFVRGQALRALQSKPHLLLGCAFGIPP